LICFYDKNRNIAQKQMFCQKRIIVHCYVPRLDFSFLPCFKNVLPHCLTNSAAVMCASLYLSLKFKLLIAVNSFTGLSNSINTFKNDKKR
jgi:hypothetical protein